MNGNVGRLGRFAALLLVAIALLLSTGGETLSAPTEQVASFQTFAFLPSDVLFAGGAKFDNPGEVWDRWVGFLERFQEDAEKERFRAEMAKMRQELGFDIRQDLLPLFRGEAALSISIESLDSLVGLGMNPNPKGAEQVLNGVLLVADCAKPDRLHEIVGIFAAKHDMPRTQAGEAGGAPVWRLGVGESGQEIPLYYTFHQGRLLASFAPSALSGAVTRFTSGPSLGGSSDFLRVRSHLPRKVTGLGYLNLPAIAKQVREAGMVRMAAASNPKALEMLDEFTSPEMVPFGMGWSTSKEASGVVRTNYGPDTLLGQLPLGSSGLAAPMMAAVALPNFLKAEQVGRSKRTMSDIRTIATVVESFAIDENRYPGQQELGHVESLIGMTEPTYVKKLPTTDGWGNPYLYWSDGERYLIVSTGEDGARERDLNAYRNLKQSPKAFPSSQKGRDIVYGDGTFLAWPEP